MKRLRQRCASSVLNKDASTIVSAAADIDESDSLEGSDAPPQPPNKTEPTKRVAIELKRECRLITSLFLNDERYLCRS